ncbi:hypothetical protein GCM10009745_21320 [Kribbella yunnanensis]|uniref:Uncharacterized protein n=1 Tax=Kribbella yunnanensis TaxID=190194 RepID=A0ABN2GVQ9_9ACTN
MDTEPERSYPSPIRDGLFVDRDGVSWRLRGGEVRWRRVRRLIQDPEVDVLHVYLDDVRAVPLSERSALLMRIAPYVEDARKRPEDHTDFRLAEFKAESRSLVVVEESC